MGTMTSQPTEREPSLESLLARANTTEELQELEAEVNRRLAGFSTASLQAAKAKIQRKQVEVAEASIRDTNQLEQELADADASLRALYPELLRAIDEVTAVGMAALAAREQYDSVRRKAREAGVQLPPVNEPLNVRAYKDRELALRLHNFQTAANAPRL
jgi:hypothetical protein